MIDLKLNACGDLDIVNGDLVLISGTAEVCQRVLIYLRTEYAEYAYDQTKGLKKFDVVFRKGASIGEIKNAFRSVVEGIEGVTRCTEVTIVDHNINLRSISVQLDLLINEDLEVTSLLFTGVPPTDNSCNEDYLLPYNLGDLLIWFDAQYADQNNRARSGSYSFVGTSGIVGNSLLDLNNKAIQMENPLGTEENYISFSDTPFIRDFYTLTFAFVIRAEALVNGDELGLLALSGYHDFLPPTPSVYNFKLKKDTLSKFKIEKIQSTGAQSAEVTIPSFENSNFILMIRIISSTVEVFIDGVLIDSFYFPYFISSDYTSGDGYIFASTENDGTFESSFNGKFGEFLFYNKALTDLQLEALTTWFQAKWNLS